MLDNDKIYLVEYTGSRGTTKEKFITTSPIFFSYYFKDKNSVSNNNKVINDDFLYVIELEQDSKELFSIKKLKKDGIDIKDNIELPNFNLERYYDIFQELKKGSYDSLSDIKETIVKIDKDIKQRNKKIDNGELLDLNSSLNLF